MNIAEWQQNPNKVKQFFGDLVTIDLDTQLYMIHYEDRLDATMLYSGRHLFDRNTHKVSLVFKVDVSFEFRIIANLGI